MTPSVEAPVALVAGANDVAIAVARRFHAAGRHVVIADADADACSSLAAELKERADAVELDVCDAQSWSRALAVLPPGCHVEVLVNAVDRMAFTPLVDETRLVPEVEAQMPRRSVLESWAHMLDHNLTGRLLGLLAVLPKMVENGRGAVVNVGSIDALRGAPGWSGYCAVDHGMIGLTKAAALEVAPFGVRVNAVSANRTMSRSLKLPQGETREFDRAIPLGRRAHADEVAVAVDFLANHASYCTGTVLVVDGGRLAGPAPSTVAGLVPATDNA